MAVSNRRSPEVLVPFIGLLYLGLVFISLILAEGASVGAFGLIIALFGILSLGSALLVWRRGRFGYTTSAVLSVVFLGLFGFEIPSALAGFADLLSFLLVITIIPVAGLTLVYSIFGVRRARKDAVMKPLRMIPATSVLALLVLGFVVGGASIGVIANGAVVQLLANSQANSGLKADITIVAGASSPGSSLSFSPPTLTVKVGSTVVWVNKDPVTHTVTSSSGNLFDSGYLPDGFVFKYTFTQVGTYQYYCTIHPSMTGTIVVTSG